MGHPPKTFSGLLAVALVGMGLIFAALGVVMAGLHLSVGSGPSWAFLPIGLLLLACGGACALCARQQNRRWARLRTEGRPVPGRVVTVRRCLWITWNVESLTTLPGQHSPWSVCCSYIWAGKEYRVNSGLLWQEPAAESPGLTVWVDPARPRQAFLDPDTLCYRWAI